MAPKLLVVDSINSSGRPLTASSVFRMDGADVSYFGAQIGSDIPAVASGLGAGTDRASWHHNPAIQVGKYIYLHIHDEIYRYDTENPSDDWTLFQTIGGSTAGNDGYIQSGFMTTIIDNEPMIFGAKIGSLSTEITTFTINTKTNVYTEDVDVSVPINLGQVGFEAAIIFKNIFFFMPGSGLGGDAVRYDIATGTVAPVAINPILSSSLNCTTFAIWNNKLYLWGHNTTNGWSLYEYDDGANQFNEAFGTTDGASLSILANSRPAMWVYNNQLHALYLSGIDGASTGWQLLRFVSGTNITLDADLSSGLPSSLQIGGFPGSEGRFSVYVDQSANPGGLAEIYLYYIGTNRQDVSDIYTQCFFDGSSVIAEDSGASNKFIIPRSMDGNGGYVFTDNSVTIEFVGMEATLNGYVITFRVFGPKNGNVQLYYNLDLEQPNILGTLSNPSVGFLDTSATTLSSVPADGTLQTVEWEAAFDGVVDDDDVKIALRAF